MLSALGTVEGTGGGLCSDGHVPVLSELGILVPLHIYGESSRNFLPLAHLHHPVWREEVE